MQRRDGITKNLSREYKTLKHNVLPDSKPLISENLNNRIKLLQVSNKLARLISHQTTVDITRTTVPILAETKKTQIQKSLRASREKFL